MTDEREPREASGHQERESRDPAVPEREAPDKFSWSLEDVGGLVWLDEPGEDEGEDEDRG